MNATDAPVFVISRHFAASPQRVYEAWADPVKMAQWSGPKGASVEILRGTQAVGETTIARTVAGNGLEMFSLNRWRELAPYRRIAFEQSFCTPEGIKCPPPFFDDWPKTLLTEVDLEPRDGGTYLTLKWIPLEYTEAALAMFVQQMASMTGGWSGSFEKLEAWLSG